jgi:hypothetical protein
MLILYSAKIWALTVEKLISPPTASLIFPFDSIILLVRFGREAKVTIKIAE